MVLQGPPARNIIAAPQEDAAIEFEYQYYW